MKTLYKTYGFSWQGDKRKAILEAKTGVKWDFYSSGDGMRFTAIVTRETPCNENAAKELLPHLKEWGHHSFVAIAEGTGMKLTDVLEAAQTLVKQGLAILIVNRMGHFASLYLRQGE